MENVHAEKDRANLLVSLDQLQADLPNCDSVLLVVSWFGTDLRCGSCQIKPGVEIADKDTTPQNWRVCGVTRSGAYVVSESGGGPAYGGTPSDASVLQAIAELKARGFKVGLYPFILMDVPAGNGLPDPYGGAEQAAYPWRGRISVHPAIGQPGTPDKTATAATQVAAFFGSAAPGDFGASGETITYSGPSEFSFRRFILHYAKLAAVAGGVDFFVLGSELRGLTTVRSSATNFPAVSALQTLAADVRGMLGGATAITYAADWSEYFGHQPQDGSGDVLFHLDPLWADANIDVIGVDWYAPLSDWRDGLTHLDRDIAKGAHDPVYLEGRIEAGEGYDFYYVSDADRTAQTRTPISDGAYAEPWVFRPKDIRNFWARAHHNRPGGVRAGSSTAWVPQSKPIWLMEFGCPAIDKGANAPNLFIDAKSDESGAPPFSSGARDDLIQRRALEAYLRHWDDDAPSNPASSIDGKPMVERMFAWCWDARPYAAFPARADVWSDGANWRRGHWLNGRAGLSGLGEVVADLCARAGVDDADVSALTGAVSGYVVDAPSTARAALEPLMAAYDFVGAEREGALTFFHASDAAPMALTLDQFAAESVGEAYAVRADGADAPVEARVRFLDASRDYLMADASARRLDRAEGGVETVAAPLVLEPEQGETLAQRLLADRRAASETLRVSLGPTQMALEPGDRITLEGDADVFEISSIEDAEARRLALRRVRSGGDLLLSLAEVSAVPAPSVGPTPAFAVLDLPPLPSAEDDERPLVGAYASPWLRSHDIYAGADVLSLTRRARMTRPAIMGELLWPLYPGPADRWDEGNVVRIKLYAGSLASVTKSALLNGANAFAIESTDGEWEVVQARNAVLVGPREYELSGFLRGQLGSAHAMRSPHPVGARIVRLDTRLKRAPVQSYEWGEALRFVAPPGGALASDARAAQQTLTLPNAGARPWPPAHPRARRLASGDVAVSWIRQARRGGDYWGRGDPALDVPVESYQLDILSGASVVRSVTVSAPAYVYSAADQTADFGAPPASLLIRVAQLGAGGAAGLNTEVTIPL
ncbi:MAG: glycoside hydrolase/phage tail family protein [Hyphomonadaceae bacterium]|nr:glycoside hydrolase/phage tail family protein [Hyphomonadaceae bacterium]